MYHFVPTNQSLIAALACSVPKFSTLCTALEKAEYIDELSEGEWTIFAPTNEAFKKLGDLLDAVLADVELLKYVLQFHAVDKILYAEDLACTHTLTMLNGENSRTVCRGADIYQKGGSNPRSDMPKIIDADIGACNGVVHVINEYVVFCVVICDGFKLVSPSPCIIEYFLAF